MAENFRVGLTFDDVLLEPREAKYSRADVSLETKLTKKITLQIPILSAAMDTVTESSMAISLGQLGGVGVLHRNCPIPQQVTWVKQIKKAGVLSSAAIGPDDLKRAQALDKAGVDIIVVDTSHAHNSWVIKNLKIVRRSVKAQIIVGNIATKEAAQALLPYADALKVGVGPGSICTTRIVAGIGVPQLTAILDVVSAAKKKNIPVIADGGIKYSGDAVKALAAGASTVMLGSLLAGTKESPGKLVTRGGHKYKSYRGMGSFEVISSGKSADRYFQKGIKTPVPEGVSGLTPYKGQVKDVIYQIAGGIRSGMGYIGARTVADMPKRARFIKITNAGLKESHPHSIEINKKSPNY